MQYFRQHDDSFNHTFQSSIRNAWFQLMQCNGKISFYKDDLHFKIELDRRFHPAFKSSGFVRGDFTGDHDHVTSNPPAVTLREPDCLGFPDISQQRLCVIFEKGLHFIKVAS